jgi:phospholipid N-methyltransferase
VGCGTGSLTQLILDRYQPKEVVALDSSPDFIADYWQPFLGHVGPAPSYTMSLAQEERQQLANKLRQSLPTDENGVISLTARAWAVKGIV